MLIVIGLVAPRTHLTRDMMQALVVPSVQAQQKQPTASEAKQPVMPANIPPRAQSSQPPGIPIASVAAPGPLPGSGRPPRTAGPLPLGPPPEPPVFVDDAPAGTSHGPLPPIGTVISSVFMLLYFFVLTSPHRMNRAQPAARRLTDCEAGGLLRRQFRRKYVFLHARALSPLVF